MKNFLRFFVQLALVFVAASQITPKNNCEDEIDQMSEKCKVRHVLTLRTKVDSSVNPLIIPAMNIKRDGYDFSLSEVAITGFQNISIKSLTTTSYDSSIWIDFLVPDLAIQSDHYHLMVNRFWIFNIDDVGKFRCKVSNLTVWGTVRLGTDGDQTIISHMHMQYALQHIKVVLTGSKPRVNEKVNGELLRFLNDKEVQRSVSLFIKDKARSYFRGFTPKEIMEAISTSEE